MKRADQYAKERSLRARKQSLRQGSVTSLLSRNKSETISDSPHIRRAYRFAVLLLKIYLWLLFSVILLSVGSFA